MLWKTKINHGISRTCFSKSGAVFEACSTYFNCRQTRLGKNQSAPGVLEWKSWLQRSESTSSRASSSKVEASNPPRDSFEDWPGINRDHKQRTACAYIYMYMYIIFIYMPNKASSTYSKYRYIRYKSNTSGFTSSKTDCKGSMATNCWMSSYISQPKKTPKIEDRETWQRLGGNLYIVCFELYTATYIGLYGFDILVHFLPLSHGLCHWS